MHLHCELFRADTGKSYVESNVVTCVGRRLVESPVGLRGFIAQLAAADYPDTFRHNLWVAWDICHPCLDAYVVGISGENASGS